MTDYLFCRCDYFTEDGQPWFGEDGAVRVEDPSCTAHEPIFTWEEE